jgi:hypothetical protein
VAGERRDRAPDTLRVALVAAAWIGIVLPNVRAIRALDRTLYTPLSRAETALALELGPHLARGEAVYLLDPFLDATDLSDLLALYHHVDPHRLTAHHLPRDAADAWLADRRRAEPGAVILDYHPLAHAPAMLAGQPDATVVGNPKAGGWIPTDTLGPPRSLRRGGTANSRPAAPAKVWIHRIAPR